MELVLRTKRVVTEEHYIEVDEDYLQTINDTLKRFYPNAPEITEHILRAIVMNERDNPLVTYVLYTTHNTPIILFDVLYDWLRDDLLDADKFTINDHIVEYEFNTK